MATTPNTRKEDDRLRKELQNADMGKFRKVIKAVFASSPEKKSHSKKNT